MRNATGERTFYRLMLTPTVARSGLAPYRASSASNATGSSETSACILVIEDDPVLSKLMAGLLREEGYTATVAHNGATALQVALESAPSVILLDMHLPDMDGASFVSAYRSAQTMHASIILCTGTDAVEAAEQTEHLEAVGFLAKPFDLDTLLTVVARHAGHADTN